MRNLVDNALKYGGETLTRIVVGYKETEDHHIVYVSDDGVGLTEEEARSEYGDELRVGRFPFTASGKAVASAHTAGFVKLLAESAGAQVVFSVTQCFV